jgi:GNAT superfamily N-acetyltransferase
MYFPYSVTANFPLKMVRPNLDQIPALTLPEGYSLRNYVPGDKHTWIGIRKATEFYKTITTDSFQEEFGTNQKALLDRQFFICHSVDGPVATATAWIGRNGAGRICGLAVFTAHAGRGLEEALVIEACNRMKQLGHKRTSLDTSSAKLWEIERYLKLGFLPDVAQPNDSSIWDDVLLTIRELNQVPWFISLIAWIKGKLDQRKEKRMVKKSNEQNHASGLGSGHNS